MATKVQIAVEKLKDVLGIFYPGHPRWEPRPWVSKKSFSAPVALSPERAAEIDAGFDAWRDQERRDFTDRCEREIERYSSW